ncbi:glucose-induced degradation protein 4 homolog isoform X1 [Podarcis muralis]
MPVRSACRCPPEAPGGASSAARLEPPPPINTAQPGVSTSRLYSGAKFRGQQRSKGNAYEVEVVVQHVDMENSYLCGYLKIKGLTEEYPTLTTFFEGEIISKKHPFLTRKWDADEDVDRKHWGKFPAFYQYAKTFNSDDFDYEDLKNDDFVFMRWKVSVSEFDSCPRVQRTHLRIPVTAIPRVAPRDGQWGQGERERERACSVKTTAMSLSGQETPGSSPVGLPDWCESVNVKPEAAGA